MYSRVYVEITNICNMHCSFCHGHSRSPRQMTEEEYDEIIDNFYADCNCEYEEVSEEEFTESGGVDA